MGASVPRHALVLTARAPDPGRREIAPTLAELAAEIAMLRDRVVVLEGRHRTRDALHTAALVALAAAVQYRTFTAKSAIAHAQQVDAALLAALHAAGVDTPRTLGRWLRTLRRTPVAGLRVERLGTTNEGALWMFRAGD
jgi:hypothetical protein